MPTTNFKSGDLVYNQRPIIVRTATRDYEIKPHTVMQIQYTASPLCKVFDEHYNIYYVFDREISPLNDAYLLERIASSVASQCTRLHIAERVVNDLFLEGYIDTKQCYKELEDIFTDNPNEWNEFE